MAKRFILLGAPGAGKGTQAKNICAFLDIKSFSTGAMLREEISKQSNIGILAQKYIDKGNLLPDELIIPMFAKTIARKEYANGFLADGFPRTLQQAKSLDQILSDSTIQLDGVLNIDIELDQVVQRLLHRAQLEGRADDNEPVIRRRLEIYQSTTAPLIDWYATKGILHTINGNQSIDEVWADIRQVL